MSRELVAITMSEVEPRPVEWLIDGRVAIGTVTVLAGLPGLGKSMLTCHWAARVSSAGANTLIATAEDALDFVVRPRLEIAGADLDRVHALRLRVDGFDGDLALPDDAELLFQKVQEHDARLVVIDPLMAHLSQRVNSWNDHSIRTALAPLHHLAEELRCAVVALAHLNKAGHSDSLLRVGASIGVGGAARSVLLLDRDPEEDADTDRLRVLAHVKSNVAVRQTSERYAIEAVQLMTAEGPTEVPYLAPIGDSRYTADELLAANRGEGDDRRSALEEAKEFLAELLAEGELPAKHVREHAAEEEISKYALNGAKKALGIVSRREGFGRGSTVYWRLPLYVHTGRDPIGDDDVSNGEEVEGVRPH